MNPRKSVLVVCVVLLASCTTPVRKSCDHACLIGVVNEYLDSVVAHDPTRVRRTPDFRETQNALDTVPGNGIWSTARRLGDGVRYADPVSGEVGFFGIIEESSETALVGLRLKVRAGSVSESEWIIARKGMALYKPEGFAAALPRTSKPNGGKVIDRDTAIKVANSYFVGIDRSSAEAVVEHPECFRIENGTHMVGRRPTEPPHTADRPAGDGLTGALSPGINHCTEGFEKMKDRTEDVIDRRFFYDPEAGVVWGHGVFKRVPGAMIRNEPLRWLNLMEIFEIDDGRIRGIYAVMDYLPKEITASGWGGRDE
jgi:hypothetical protein